MSLEIYEACVDEQVYKWAMLVLPFGTFSYSVGAEGLQVSYSHKLQAGPAAEQEIHEVGKKSQESRQ